MAGDGDGVLMFHAIFNFNSIVAATLSEIAKDFRVPFYDHFLKKRWLLSLK
jgi:hypothetical protein